MRILKWLFGGLLVVVGALWAALTKLADIVGRTTAPEDAEGLYKRAEPVLTLLEQQPELWPYVASGALVVVGLALLLVPHDAAARLWGWLGLGPRQAMEFVLPSDFRSINKAEKYIRVRIHQEITGNSLAICKSLYFELRNFLPDRTLKNVHIEVIGIDGAGFLPRKSLFFDNDHNAIDIHPGRIVRVRLGEQWHYEAADRMRVWSAEGEQIDLPRQVGVSNLYLNEVCDIGGVLYGDRDYFVYLAAYADDVPARFAKLRIRVGDAAQITLVDQSNSRMEPAPMAVKT